MTILLLAQGEFPSCGESHRTRNVPFWECRGISGGRPVVSGMVSKNTGRVFREVSFPAGFVLFFKNGDGMVPGMGPETSMNAGSCWKREGKGPARIPGARLARRDVPVDGLEKSADPDQRSMPYCFIRAYNLALERPERAQAR
jgi:hypothetical protein